MGEELAIVFLIILIFAVPVVGISLLIVLNNRQLQQLKEIKSLKNEIAWLRRTLTLPSETVKTEIEAESDKIIEPKPVEPEIEIPAVSVPLAETSPEPEFVAETLLESEPATETPPELQPLVDRQSESDQATEVSSEPGLITEIPPEPVVKDSRVKEILKKIWNWIVVGEEFRSEGMSAEFAIASNWLLRFGIIVIVMGIGFFLKYSIETGLLTPRARVSLSILAALAMLVTGTRLFKGRYHLFAQGLTGGGIAVLYFSFFSAFYFHHFISHATAFALMAVITVSACVLAVRYDSLLTAIIGLIGGYGTPVMLSTDEVSYSGLFLYFLLLGVGIFATTLRREWRLLNYLGMISAYTLTSTALSSFTSKDFWEAFPFIFALFVLYSSICVAHNLFQKIRSTVLEIIAVLVNGFAFFCIAHRLFNQSFERHWLAILTLVLAAFYTMHVYYIILKKHKDRNLITAFLGLGAFFITITIPLAVSDDWLSVCWAIQALVLLWIALRIQSRFLELAAYIVYLIVISRFFLWDLIQSYPISYAARHASTIDFLCGVIQRLITLGTTSASLYFASILKKRRVSPLKRSLTSENNIILPVKSQAVIVTGITMMTLAMFIGLHLEIFEILRFFYPPGVQPGLTLVWSGLLIFLFVLQKRLGYPILAKCMKLVFLGLMIKILFIDCAYWDFIVHRLRYGGSYSIEDSVMRFLDFVIPGLFAFYVWKKSINKDTPMPASSSDFGWISLIILFLFTTFELHTVLSCFLPGFKAGGVSILWVGFALALVVSGIRNQNKSARYSGLILFTTVLLKVFIFDLDRLEPVWRIVAFIILGILTLCGSFVYLKYKGEYISDEHSENKN